MSFPFGGHPKLADYIGQARHDHQAKASFGVATDEDGATEYTTRITIPKTGKTVHLVGIQQTDYLTPIDIGHLDRRLGIKSPYFSVEQSV